jgi:hypothetical protein
MKLRQILEMKGGRLAGVAFIALLLCAGVVSNAHAGGAHYKHRQGTGLARAFCPSHMPVIGGGAFVETPPPPGAFKEEKLRQTHPISDKTGVIAFGTTAIGWQAASSDFTDTVAAFSICAAPDLAAVIDVQYESAQGIGVARAFCPAGALVAGGGGFVESPPGGGFKEEVLRQTHPISDATGVIAFGTTAIGWQAASSDFTDTVVAFAVCATPIPGATVVAQYQSAQDTGIARAFCPAGTTLTGGGGFVETPPGEPFREEKLRQTYPISDPTGVIAHGTNAIGWQVASSDFTDTVVAIAICTSY